jgi:hypothetical protein
VKQKFVFETLEPRILFSVWVQPVDLALLDLGPPAPPAIVRSEALVQELPVIDPIRLDGDVSALSAYSLPAATAFPTAAALTANSGTGGVSSAPKPASFVREADANLFNGASTPDGVGGSANSDTPPSAVEPDPIPIASVDENLWVDWLPGAQERGSNFVTTLSQITQNLNSDSSRSNQTQTPTADAATPRSKSNAGGQVPQEKKQQDATAPPAQIHRADKHRPEGIATVIGESLAWRKAFVLTKDPKLLSEPDSRIASRTYSSGKADLITSLEVLDLPVQSGSFNRNP